MVTIKQDFDKELIEKLRSGGVAIIRTDTIYGIVARADLESSVERIYAMKGRTPTKSPIVLIDSRADLYDSYDAVDLEVLKNIWPGKNSVILQSKKAPAWIKRQNNSVAYRLPSDTKLRRLLNGAGPLVAPSANPEGFEPATTIEQAIDYFGDRIDIYVDSGAVSDNTPSKLYRLLNGKLERLR